DGEIKDLSPSDLNDQIIMIPFKRDNMEAACRAARDAYLPWARKSMDERKSYILRLKEVFETHTDEMAELIARDTGKPLWESMTEAKALLGKIDITLNQSLKLIEEERLPNALPQVEGVIRYKPRGIMAVIGPFNFPA